MKVVIQKSFSARTAPLNICSLHWWLCTYNALPPAHELHLGSTLKKMNIICTLHFPDYFADLFQMQQLDTLWKSDVFKLIGIHLCIFLFSKMLAKLQSMGSCSQTPPKLPKNPRTQVAGWRSEALWVKQENCWWQRMTKASSTRHPGAIFS